jgi:hypothetical protein
MYGNVITNPSTAFGLSLTGNPSIPVTTTNGPGTGVFTLSFTAFVSNSLEKTGVSVLFGSTEIISTTMWLFPSDFDSSRSYVLSGFDAPFVVGTPIVLTIVGKDAYGNDWLCRNLARCASVFATPGTGGLGQPSFNNFNQATVTPIDPTLVGNHTGWFRVTWVPVIASTSHYSFYFS